MTTIKDLIVEYLNEEDCEAFAEWAWGESFKEINYVGNEPIDLWNKKHGMELEIFPYGQPYIDIPKMIDIWKKEKLQKQDSNL